MIVHDDLCERNVIGVLATYENAYFEAGGILCEELFYNEEWRAIYRAMKSLADNGTPIAITSIAAELQKAQKPDLINNLMEATTNTYATSDFTFNCSRLADLSKRRRLAEYAYSIASQAASEACDTSELLAKAAEGLRAISETGISNVKSIGEVLPEVFNIIAQNAAGNHTTGIVTGFSGLDRLGGFQFGSLVVVAAESSQGKTSFAVDVCTNAAKNGYPSAFYSLEMTSRELSARIMARYSGISSRRILQESLTSDEADTVRTGSGNVAKLPVYFDDTATLGVDAIIASIRKMVRTRGVKIAFVDYLQILQTNRRISNQTEEQFFGEVSRRLKNLAKELEICVVLLSQLARNKDNPEPSRARLRGSGQIDEAADVVLLIYRPEVYGRSYSGKYADVSTDGTALIIQAKGRSVGTGSFICGFDAPLTHFKELSSVPHDEDAAPF